MSFTQQLICRNYSWVFTSMWASTCCWASVKFFPACRTSPDRLIITARMPSSAASSAAHTHPGCLPLTRTARDSIWTLSANSSCLILAQHWSENPSSSSSRATISLSHQCTQCFLTMRTECWRRTALSVIATGWRKCLGMQTSSGATAGPMKSSFRTSPITRFIYSRWKRP